MRNAEHQTIFENYKQVTELSERNKAIFVLVDQMKHLKTYSHCSFSFGNQTLWLMEETLVTNSESDRIVKYSANSDMVNSVLTASFTDLLSALKLNCSPLNFACFDSN
jgi:hypothetical protein